MVGGRADGARGATRREDAASGTAGRREAILSARIDGILRTAAPRAIVLTLPSSYQRIGGAEAGRREDPNLGSVIPALTAAGIEPIVVGWGMSSQSDEDWAIVEADDRMLPAFALKGRWGSPEDDGRGATAADAVLRGLDSMIGVPVLLDGLDVGPDFLVVLRGLLARVVRGEIVELARVERLMREVAPAAILVTQEHHRTPWLVGASRAGVPSFALQHGMLYAAHPGYPDRRHDGLVLPTLTFVFGDFERRVLLGTAYTPADVAVSGSPRLDLDAAAGSPEETATAREDVRRELGIAAGDLLVVVSTVPAHFIRRSHLVHMLETLLDGHLPGVHIVFKLHPGERDQGPYRALIAGLARAGGYVPPAISVVKDIDLYRLLRAADAHLGQQSTVLTDAVVANTPNLIARVDATADHVGYVAAGVARPVSSVAQLREALAEPRPISPDAREAFLADHFRSGDASERIAATIRDVVAARVEPGVAGAR